MPTLRSAALRIASELPEGDPTRRKLLASVRDAAATGDKAVRALRVTIGDMETDMRRKDSIDASPYIKNLEAHAKEVEGLDAKVARSIRVTAGDMKADMDRRGKVEPKSLKSYVANLKADLARLG